MTRLWWQRPRWWGAAFGGLTTIALLAAFLEATRWARDGHDVAQILLPLGVMVACWTFIITDFVVWTRRLGSSEQRRAFRRSFRTGVLPPGADLPLWRINLARVRAQEVSGSVVGTSVGVATAAGWYSRPAQPDVTAVTLSLFVAIVAGSAWATLQSWILTRTRRHLDHLHECVDLRIATDARRSSDRAA